MERKTMQNALKLYKKEGFTSINLNSTSEELENELFEISDLIERKLSKSVNIHSLAVSPKKYVKLLKEFEVIK